LVGDLSATSIRDIISGSVAAARGLAGGRYRQEQGANSGKRHTRTVRQVIVRP
jgi:hypothetical protein